MDRKDGRALRNSAGSLLGVFSYIASKNADTACRGFMYEPNVPKKLKKLSK
ncbi:MAG: cyclic lactone autoinducer peptide [Lachnospiraceae bacterium]|nr:cyclic lactone autoinducer peptide [Lachnospiraceae bacterium]